MTRRIDEWRKRPEIIDGEIASSNVPDALEAGSPEAAAADDLAVIAGRNFGHLATMTIDYTLRPVNQRAGMHRTELGEVTVTGWRIVGVGDGSPAISVETVWLEGTRGDTSWDGEDAMRLIYSDDNFDALVRGADGGRWAVMPNFIPALWGTTIRTAG